MAKVTYSYKPQNKMAKMLFIIGLTALLIEGVLLVHMGVTNSFGLLQNSMTEILNALMCNFTYTSINGILVLSASVFFYLGLILAVVVMIIAIAKKRYKAMLGSISCVLVSVLALFDLSLMSTYLSSGVAGANVVSMIFFVIFIALLIMLGIAIDLSIKFSYELRYNWETNFVFNEQKDVVSPMFSRRNYQEVDKEFVNVLDLDDVETEELEQQPQQEVVEQQPQQEAMEEVKQEPQKEEVGQVKQEVVEETQEDEEEYDEELAHLEDEMEEDEDDNLEEPQDEEEKDENGFPKIVRQNLTFAQKIRRCNKQTRDNYKTIRKYFESVGFKSKITKTGNSYLYKNTKYAVISTSGKTGLKIYYKLDLQDYVDSPIPLRDVSDVKKYEKTPALLVVKSNLSVKRAKKLIDEMKSKLD